MMQQLNSEKLVVQACIEGSYEKALQAVSYTHLDVYKRQDVEGAVFGGAAAE